jgi:hypothetical protein
MVLLRTAASRQMTGFVAFPALLTMNSSVEFFLKRLPLLRLCSTAREGLWLMKR